MSIVITEPKRPERRESFPTSDEAYKRWVELQDTLVSAGWWGPHGRDEAVRPLGHQVQNRAPVSFQHTQTPRFHQNPTHFAGFVSIASRFGAFGAVRASLASSPTRTKSFVPNS